MRSFRRRRSFGAKRPGNWVTYVNDDPFIISAYNAANTAAFVANLSHQDVITGVGAGSGGGSVGYMGNVQEKTIVRFQGAIFAWLNPDDAIDSQQFNNLMMLNYLWRKVDLNAGAAGGLTEFTATDFDPSAFNAGDLGKILRFRNIMKWGTVHVWGGVDTYVESHGVYSGVTTGAAVLNSTAPLDTMGSKGLFSGPGLARIPFPRAPIKLREGQVLQCIASAWSPRQFSGQVSTRGRGVLGYQQFRAYVV